MKSLRQSILAKILSTVIGIVVLGFGVLLYVVIGQEKNSSIEEKKRASELMAQPIIHDINTDMLDGRADLVRHLIEDLKIAKNIERMQIIRSNGTEEAFQDLKTIRAVEKEYGDPEPAWLANHPDKEHNVALGVDNPRFQEAVKLFNEGRKDVIYYLEEHDGKRLLTYLVPIEAKPKCRSCHATYEEARGVLMISTSLEDMYAMLKSSRNSWMIVGFFIILGVTLLVSFMVKSIVEPIQRVSSAARDIASGRYNISIPVKTSDEIGVLSESFNQMAHEIGAKTEELRRLAIALEQSINIVFITDIKGNIEYVNRTFEEITGWLKENALGRNFLTLISGDITRDQYEELWRAILAGKTFRDTFRNRKKNGNFYWVNVQIIPIKDEKGESVQFLVMQEDITEKKKAEERAGYLTVYDELTGLFNRTWFMDLMDKWIHGVKGYDRNAALFLIDIDEFKSLNELYGHHTGDEFLRHTALLLKETVENVHREFMIPSQEAISGTKAKTERMTAHLGGDEFAIFITDINEKDAINIAEVMRRKLDGFDFKALTVRLTASIGIALYPEHGIAVRDLLSKADIAMYRAKEKGRNRCHLYEPADRDLEKIHSRLREKERIQNCISTDCFEPWFQPILCLEDNKIHHYEALARMRDKDGTILLPGVFIDTAEIFGLVGAIDKIITEKTVKIYEEIRNQGHDISFSINLSGKDFGDNELLDFFKTIISKQRIDPGHLIFEITETAAVHDMARAKTFIHGLKSIGCHFCLDDFGVGFTSFVYLRELQIDYIKIDGSFIKNLHQNRNDQLFVKAIADVAKGMGIKTIAEFVENKETIKLLKEYGIDYAQGYAIGKPAPWEEIYKAS
ncbi:MAG TPA: EAL domain-containing protein [bacterium]